MSPKVAHSRMGFAVPAQTHDTTKKSEHIQRESAMQTSGHVLLCYKLLVEEVVPTGFSTQQMSVSPTSWTSCVQSFKI